MEVMVNGSIDGFMVSIAKETLLKKDFHHLNEVINQGFPVVLFDRVVDEVPCDKVVVDDKKAAMVATQALIDDGRKHILLLTTMDHIGIGRERTLGYTEVLEKNGLPVEADLMLKMPDAIDEEGQEMLIGQHLTKLSREGVAVDAIFGVNEMYAVAALNVCRQIGMEVPKELSVISFSNGVLSKYSRPKLTTINQHGFELGRATATMLIDRLEGNMEEEVFHTKLIRTSLIERESTRVHASRPSEVE